MGGRGMLCGSYDRRTALAFALLAPLVLSAAKPVFAQSDPLPSWNEDATKKAIVDFVSRVTTQGGADFVPPAERIATFDNDGTLWCEQPVYFQLAFTFDQIDAMAPQHPEWKSKQPFKALLEKDMKALAASGQKGLLQIMATTHAGVTTDAFAKAVLEWTRSARHPRFNRPYIDLVYQPMLELLSYLRANGFKTFIVSGGGIEFMRFIGRRPIFAFGNSDGDLQMLQWTAAGPGVRPSRSSARQEK